MANLADCAFAIAKDDVEKTGGAIRRARPDEKGSHVEKSVYEDTKTGDEYIYYYKWENGGKSECRLKKNGELFMEATCYKEVSKVAEIVKEMKYIRSETIRDIDVENGWCVDWVKLNSYSYDYTPMIYEHGDHITVYFGGRWSFPDTLEEKLNSFDVRWQGAGCEDGCDWQCEDLGTYDFGLRIHEQKEYCDGEPYYEHYVEDIS